jgi:hypothetical protein
MAWALQGNLTLDAVHGMVAFGTVGACAFLTLWGFRRA